MSFSHLFAVIELEAAFKDQKIPLTHKLQGLGIQLSSKALANREQSSISNTTNNYDAKPYIQKVTELKTLHSKDI